MEVSGSTVHGKVVPRPPSPEDPHLPSSSKRESKKPRAPDRHRGCRPDARMGGRPATPRGEPGNPRHTGPLAGCPPDTNRRTFPASGKMQVYAATRTRLMPPPRARSCPPTPRSSWASSAELPPASHSLLHMVLSVCDRLQGCSSFSSALAMVLHTVLSPSEPVSFCRSSRTSADSRELAAP